jgi:vacuolar-type H+-ATPase subunit F/Vma7
VQRGDVGLIIMNQPVADQIRTTVAAHTLSVPMVLEIPASGGGGSASAQSDPIMKRVLQMLGEGQ